MKAVIKTGGKQYLVQKGDVIEVDRINGDSKKATFEPLLFIGEKEVKVGTPTVSKHSVEAEIVDETRGDKVVAIRFKAKKRVNKKRGHRQYYTRLRITKVE